MTATPGPITSEVARTLRLRQYDKALADFDKAAQLDPDDADVPEARGRAYFDQKKYELAVADFGSALEFRPDDAVLHRRRGEAFRRTKHYDEALADLDRALELDPRSATAARSPWPCLHRARPSPGGGR